MLYGTNFCIIPICIHLSFCIFCCLFKVGILSCNTMYMLSLLGWCIGFTFYRHCWIWTFFCVSKICLCECYTSFKCPTGRSLLLRIVFNYMLLFCFLAYHCLWCIFIYIPYNWTFWKYELLIEIWLIKKSTNDRYYYVPCCLLSTCSCNKIANSINDKIDNGGLTLS
jgi:hypothetical protein